MSRIPSKENKFIEFKEKLNPKIHLKEDKRQKLAAQMKHKLENGDGKAIYIIGVDDHGKTVGLTEIEFEETVHVLRTVAAENSAEIKKIEKFEDQGKLIGRLFITTRGKAIKNHLVIGLGGHVNHGKSTLIACLMTGRPDKEGKHWLYLDVLPHEIERGLSADLHYGLFGFKNATPLYFKNPLDKKERAKVMARADKLISIVDTVGHEMWQRTTVRGLVGQDVDYGLLVVAADDGVTHITKEHLGIMLAMKMPVIVCITKIDKVGNERVEEIEREIDELLKNVGKIPYKIKRIEDVSVVIDKMQTVIPLFHTSAVTLEGYDLLENLLLSLIPREKNVKKPFLMFIDHVYNISGVGTVVSGTIKQGKLKPGKELLLGPNKNAGFKRVRAKSIEMHYHPLSEAEAGLVVGISLRGVKYDEVERGMILCDPNIKPKAYKEFEAEILVLNHPTRVANGYEPVVHDNTISEAVKIKCLSKPYLKAGEFGKVRMTFKFKPHFIQVGDKFVFREGKTKGIGTILKILR